MKKLLGVPRFENLIPMLAMFSSAAQRQQTEYTGCVFPGGSKDMTHPWKVLMSNAKEKVVGTLQC